VLPGPQPSDAELLATLGIDLDAVERRLKESFGWEAYYYAAQRVRLRRTHPFPHAPLGGTPMVCWRALRFAAEEATARHQKLGPEHLLLGLLRDAQDPLGIGLYPQDRRLRGLLGLPDHGPHPVKLLVEAQGLGLDGLRAAVLGELDPDR
jgi:Clp amino terminal domain, pathogenicity island component